MRLLVVCGSEKDRRDRRHVRWLEPTTKNALRRSRTHHTPRRSRRSFSLPRSTRAFIPPGMNPNAPAAPAAAAVPRFHDFRILANQAITDSSAQNDLLDVFGHESNFTEAKETCFFPEFGFAMAQPNGPVADVLVSF